LSECRAPHPVVNTAPNANTLNANPFNAIV